MACAMPNPLFDERQDFAADGSEGQQGDGDGDPADTSESEDEDEPADTGSPDLPEDEQPASCSPTIHEGLSPMFGDPVLLAEVCQNYISIKVKVFAKDTGQWMAGACPAGDCSECNMSELHPLGILGLPIDELIPAPPPNFNQPSTACYHVEAAYPAGKADACYYDAIAVWTADGPGTAPILVAVSNGAPLGPLASHDLQDWWPDTAPIGEPCACELAQGVPCCDEETAEIETFEYLLDGVKAKPGGAPASVEIAGQPYEFIAAQAQEGVSCDQPEQYSWAIYRTL